MPYVCEGTVVRDRYDRDGVVISVNHETGVIVVRSGGSYFAESLDRVKIISYKGAE